MDKKSIFRIEVYNVGNVNFYQVTNTFTTALNALECIVCNLQCLKKFEHYSAFITECKFSNSGVLTAKTVKNKFCLALFTEFDLTDDIHQFHNIAMKLIERKNEIEAANSGTIV